MRIAALPTFRKLYGKLDADIDKGEYNIVIENNFLTKNYDGKKYIVLSTTNEFGGKNYALGGCLIGSAGLSIIDRKSVV